MERPIESYEFFQKLCALEYVDVILLYGSRARGDHKERSDIDLAIKCPNATPVQWHKIIEIIENADTLLHIDCVRFDVLHEDERFRQNILRDAKVLFQRGK